MSTKNVISKTRGVVSRFSETWVPEALAYGIAILSVILGFVLCLTDPTIWPGTSYGSLFDTVPPMTGGLVLLLLGAFLGFGYRVGPDFGMIAAGSMTAIYSLLAYFVASSDGGFPHSPDLFLLMLFAGYVSGIVALTCSVARRG